MKKQLTTISHLLNQKEYSVKFIRVHRSSISFWQTEGLLDKPALDRKWRKFSLFDILWISIIVELHEFGYSNPKLKKLRKHLFKKVTLEDGSKLSLLEHRLIEIITYGIPSFLIIDKEGKHIQLVDDKAYMNLLQSEKIGNHIIINLNQSVRDNISSLYTAPTYSEVTGLSENELEVLAIIRTKDYQSIKITKKSGAIDMVEGVERIQGEQKIIDLLKQGKYQNIEVKQSNGKVVCINRTVKKKLSSKK